MYGSLAAPSEWSPPEVVGQGDRLDEVLVEAEGPGDGPRHLGHLEGVGQAITMLFLGLGRQIEDAYDASGQLRSESEALGSYVDALWSILEANMAAVKASGLNHNELWSYRIDGGVLRPVRYGTSSDIQLWNVTDLAVGFLLDGLPAR